MALIDIAGKAAEQERQRLREAQEKERQRVLGLVNEDLRKEIAALLTDIHQESFRNKGAAISPITRTIARFASLLGALSRQADAQATDNLVMQRRVVRLTERLYWLTVALMGVAVVQIALAYLQLKQAKISNRQHEQAEHARSQAEQDKLKDIANQIK